MLFRGPLVSRDPVFSFTGQVVVGCRVGEPAVVVARGIRDLGATLYDPIRRMLRPVAKRFDIKEFHEAEEALSGCATPRSSCSWTRTRSPRRRGSTAMCAGRPG
ncbi:hypothetical protein Acsp03_01110 [Actinomadura sp. NBRC 104412]|nr:hypothetical protein Acsp03_01110 [Actinomadura sp. NBRC 104412]